MGKTHQNGVCSHAQCDASSDNFFMTTTTKRLLTLGLFAVGVAGFAVWQAAPVQADSTESATSLWHESSVSASSYGSAELPFATDHFLVKLRNGEQMTINIESVDVLDDALAAWSANPAVLYAEPDHIYRSLAQEASWGYTAVNADDALTTNSATGSGIKVAVVDTGVDYEHVDLDANNWVNTGETADDGLDNDGNGYVDDKYGYDFIGSLYTAVTPDSDPQDEAGHGTHVAGIIAAENNTVGVIGVAPSATYMPVKVLDAGGYGWDSTIANGIMYAADNGADIINLSLGSSFATHTVSDAIDYAESAGVLVIAAAGNSGTYTGSSYPAQYGNVVSVAAEDEDGKKAYFSNWGKVDVMAPGVDINSTTPGDTYEKYSGTSMATPYVAGVAALVAQDSSISNDPDKLRHVLEVNSSDWGTITGPDYVSGQGLVDALAATGTQTARGSLYADTGWIAADGSDTAIITLSTGSATNAPLTSQTVNWTTDRGTLSAASSTTDSSGQASVTLIADDNNGLATITASSTAFAADASMQIAIVTDKVKPETVGMTLYDPTGATYGTRTLSYNQFAAGDQAQIWTYATSADRETHDDVTMAYSVTDPNGDDVSDLSGTSESVEVGMDYYGWFYVNQTRITSEPLTIPSDATDGKYTVTVTVTDNDSGETATRTSNFWIGSLPTLLLVYDSGYCGDTPVQGWDAGGMPMCSRTGHALYSDLRDLGYSVMLWDTTDIGYPTSDDMAQFPLVIYAAAGLVGVDSSDLQAYMDLGGSVLVSSELAALYEGGWTGAPSDFLWNYMHVRSVSEQFTPDVVHGVDGGIFDGVTFNTDYYDLNGNGAHTSFYSNELGLNAEDDAEAILAFDVGDSTEMTAGVRVATDTYRSVFLGFGIESVNDDSGDATRSHMLDTLVTWLLGNGPNITTIGNSTVLNNTDRTITVHGHGFQAGGTTTVRLGGLELSSSVVGRATILATVPAGFTPGTYKLKVINPDGRKDSKAQAVTVTAGGPIVESVTPGYASNNIARTLVVSGLNFKSDSVVKLGSDTLSEVTFDSPTQLTVEIPAGQTTGYYTLKVTNPNGEFDKIKRAVKVRYGFDVAYTNGDVADGIKKLEKRLDVYGFFNKTPDTTFDDDTQNALLRYQNSLGINESGLLDYLTRYNLNHNE